MRSGFVSFVGRPNVGKSTLLNQIIGSKIAITSDKPQTTRNIIQGIYNDDDTQIVFVDTPGIHKPTHKLGQILNRGAYYSIDDVDVVCLLIDARAGLGKGDKYIIERLKDINKPVILIINKIDGLSKDEILLKINEYKDLYNFAEIVPISALKNKNIDELIKVIKNYLPDNIKYFDENIKTNRSMQFMIAETVREKILWLTKEEVPHSVLVSWKKLLKIKIKTLLTLLLLLIEIPLKKLSLAKVAV